MLKKYIIILIVLLLIFGLFILPVSVYKVSQKVEFSTGNLLIQKELFLVPFSKKYVNMEVIHFCRKNNIRMPENQMMHITVYFNYAARKFVSNRALDYLIKYGNYIVKSQKITYENKIKIIQYYMEMYQLEPRKFYITGMYELLALLHYLEYDELVYYDSSRMNGLLEKLNLEINTIPNTIVLL